MHAGLELYESAPDRVTLLEKYVAFAKVAERMVSYRVDAGVQNFTPGDLHQAKYVRIDAEIQLVTGQGEDERRQEVRRFFGRTSRCGRIRNLSPVFKGKVAGKKTSSVEF